MVTTKRKMTKTRVLSRILTVYNYGEETKILNYQKIPNVDLKVKIKI